MTGTWLPGDLRDRIQDLCKNKKLSLADLAQEVNLDKSTLSRFLTGKTEKLSDDAIIRIARHFQVSTDFLLGVSNIPDRKNYNIEELGLTAAAAANLYRGKVDTGVLCQLLEHQRFGGLTKQIALFQQETVSSGIAAQNQMLSSISTLLLNQGKAHPEDKQAADQAVQAVQALHRPLYADELQSIQNSFMQIVRDLKEKDSERIKKTAALTKETMSQITNTMTKDESAINLHSISPDQLIGTLFGTLSLVDVPEQIAPQMNETLRDLQTSALRYLSLLSQAKETMNDQ